MHATLSDHRPSGTFLPTGKKQGKRDMDPDSPDGVDPLYHMTGGVKSGLCGHCDQMTRLQPSFPSTPSNRTRYLRLGSSLTPSLNEPLWPENFDVDTIVSTT